MRASPARDAAADPGPLRVVPRVPRRARRSDAACALRRAGDRRARDAPHLLRLKPGSLPCDAHAGGAEGGAADREVPTLEAFRAEVDLGNGSQ